MEKKIKITGYFSILKETVSRFSSDRVLKLSAALAYYTIFSLPSMLIVIIGLCSIFLGRDAVQGNIFLQIKNLVGAEAAAQIQDMIKKTALSPGNTLATIAGAIALLISATGMFGEIQDSINNIWGLRLKAKQGVAKILLDRLISFSMVLVLGFIFLVSLLLNAVLELFFDHLKNIFPGTLISALYYLDYIIMLGVVAMLFAFIFKALPDAKIQWKDVWVGALVTSVLFSLGKFLISYYLTHFAGISAYGAAGSSLVILLWIYYSAVILYFGAEFTQAHVRQKGRRIAPNKYTVWVEENIIEKKDNLEAGKKKINKITEKEPV